MGGTYTNWGFDRNTLIGMFSNDLVTAIESDYQRREDEGWKSGKMWKIAAWEWPIFQNVKKFQEELNGRGVYCAGMLSTFSPKHMVEPISRDEFFASPTACRVCKEALQLLRMRELSDGLGGKFFEYRASNPREVEDFYHSFYLDRDYLRKLFTDTDYSKASRVDFASVEHVFIVRLEKDKKEGKVTLLEEWGKSCQANFEQCHEELRQKMTVCVGKLLTGSVAELEDADKFRLCDEAIKLMHMKEVLEWVGYSKRKESKAQAMDLDAALGGEMEELLVAGDEDKMDTVD